MRLFIGMFVVVVALAACGLKKAKAGIEKSQMSLLILDDATRADRAYALASK